MQDLAAAWAARNCFFMGAFDKRTDEFVAQVYVGPTSWNVPEFEIGYFADKDHEGQGYVSEAARAALGPGTTSTGTPSSRQATTRW